MASLAGLILAKGGSVRLPGKNRRPFKGVPMFLVNTKKCLKIFSRTFVSSDDDWILEEAEDAGATPIKRPIELCGDTPNIPVYQHALQFMNGVDGIVAVQANSPTINSKIIENVKELLLMGANEVMTKHQDGTIYGSVWGLSRKRLENYVDPYKPKPDILLCDTSIDIHSSEDFIKALNQK
jgi:CMP-N-acetylneuraminic acid synthetase